MGERRTTWVAGRCGSGVCLAAGALAAVLLTGCALTSAVTAPCDSTGVQITVGQFGVGNGHFGGALLFRNRSSTTCTLRGLPVARAVRSDPVSTVSALRSARGYVGGLLPGHSQPPVVTLSPGAMASAILEGTTASNTRQCPTYRAVLVGVPEGPATTVLPIESAGCHRLQVHPIVPGVSGDQSP
jgi:hypothetical protein